MIKTINTTLPEEYIVKITKEEYTRLQSHSRMLGTIGSYVEDFCESEEDTTLAAVICLLQKYHELQAERYYTDLEKERAKYDSKER